MPELPEVETIKVGLQKYLVGKTIVSVEVRLQKQIQGDTANIIGATITGVERFGKGLVISLSNGYCLAIHIKMTGQLIYRDELVTNEGTYVEVPNNYTHVIFTLKTENGKQGYLYYNDLRQFGWIKIIQQDALRKLVFFKELGPEPPVAGALEGRASLSEEQFAKILQTSTKMKPLLMDQKKIAGIGNIYANDALYLARIDPRRKANTLSEEEVKRLFKAILTVLKRGIAAGGSSENNYVNALGNQGSYQKQSLVYGKEGEQCPNCHTTIQKIMLAGRGTFLCPTCQK